MRITNDVKECIGFEESSLRRWHRGCDAIKKSSRDQALIYGNESEEHLKVQLSIVRSTKGTGLERMHCGQKCDD